MWHPPDVLNEVQGTGEASLNYCEGILPLWRVSSEGEDVLNAIALHLPGASEHVSRCSQSLKLQFQMTRA